MPTAAFLAIVALPAHAEVRYVFQISVDGLRGDLLQELVGSAPLTYPTFVRLQAEGAATFNARTDFTHTLTVPNHVTMLTGRPVSQPVGQPNTTHHGYTRNVPFSDDTIHDDGNPNLAYMPSVFDVVHDNGGSTALYVSKTRLTLLDRSYDAVNGARNDDFGRDKIDMALITTTTSTLVPALIAGATDLPRQYTFIHLTDPDSAGHSDGWGSPQYNAAVASTDEQVGRLLELVTTDDRYAGRTAIIVTADHGGSETDHVSAMLRENYTIPFFLWAPGVPAGADLYDLMPNRFDPGDDRPDYNAAMQPIRNGDGPNLALLLLGLPPITGSSILPQLQLPAGPGDVDRDGDIDADDIDDLFANLGSTDPRFDVDGDGPPADADDVAFLLHDILMTRPGDANLDGLVNIADLSTLAIRFGAPGGWAAGDSNGDQIVDITDLSALATWFGFDQSAAQGGPAHVPTPPVILAFVAIPAIRLRRTKVI